MGRPGCKSCCGTVREYPPECLTPVGVDYYNFGDGFKDVEDYVQYLLEQGEKGLFGLNAHKKVLAKNNTHEYKATLGAFAPQYVKVPDAWGEQQYIDILSHPRVSVPEIYLNTPWQETQSSFMAGSSDLGVLVPLKWSVNFSGGYQLISEIVGFDTTTHNLEPMEVISSFATTTGPYDVLSVYSRDVETSLETDNQIGVNQGLPISANSAAYKGTTYNNQLNPSMDYTDSKTSANMRIQAENMGFSFERIDSNGNFRPSYWRPALRKTKTKDNIIWTRTLLSPKGEVLYAQKNRVPYREIVNIYGKQGIDGQYRRVGTGIDGIYDARDDWEVLGPAGPEQHMFRITKNNCYLPIPSPLGDFYVSRHMMSESLFEYMGSKREELNYRFSLGLSAFDVNTSLGGAKHPALGLGLAGYLACTYCLGHNYSIMNYYHAELPDASPNYSYSNTGVYQAMALSFLDEADPKNLFGHTMYAGVGGEAFRTAEVVTEGWALLNPYSQTLEPFNLSELDRRTSVSKKPRMIFSTSINYASPRSVQRNFFKAELEYRLTPTDEEIGYINSEEDIKDWPILTAEQIEKFPVAGWDTNFRLGMNGPNAYDVLDELPELSYDETPEIWQELWKIKYRGMMRFLLTDINVNAHIGGQVYERDEEFRRDNSHYATKLWCILTPNQLLSQGVGSNFILPHHIETERTQHPDTQIYGHRTSIPSSTEMIKYVAIVSKDVAYGIREEQVVSKSNTTQMCFISTDNYPAAKSAQVIRHSTNVNYDGVLSWRKGFNYTDAQNTIYERMREEPGFKLWGEALGILGFGSVTDYFDSTNNASFADTDPNILPRSGDRDINSSESSEIYAFPTKIYHGDGFFPGVLGEAYGEYYHLAPVQVPIAGGSQIIGIGNKDLTVGDMVVPTDRPAGDTSLWVITQVKATKKDEDEVYYIRKLSDPEEGTIISEKNVVRPDKEYQQGFYWSSLGVLNMQAKYLNGEHADPTMYRVTNIELFAGGASLSMTRPGAVRFYSKGGMLGDGRRYEEGVVRDGTMPLPNGRSPSYANGTYPKLPFSLIVRESGRNPYRSTGEEADRYNELTSIYKNSSWNEYITISPQMSVGISEFPKPFVGWSPEDNLFAGGNQTSTARVAYDAEATFTVFFSPSAGKSVKHTCAVPYDPAKGEPDGGGGKYRDGSNPTPGPTIHYEAKIFPNGTLPSEILSGDGYKLCYNIANRNSLVRADRFMIAGSGPTGTRELTESSARAIAREYMWDAEALNDEKYDNIGDTLASSRRYGDAARASSVFEDGGCNRATAGIIVQNGVYFNLTDDIQLKFTLEPVGGNNPELEKRRKVGVDMNLPQALRAGRKNPTLEEDKDNPLLIGIFDPPDPELDHTAGLKIPKVGGGHMTLPVNLWQGHSRAENHERQKVLGCVKMPDYTSFEVEVGGLPEEIIKKIPPSEVKKSTFQDFNEAIDTLNGNSIIIADEPSPIWTSVPADLGKISNADLDQLTVDGLNGPKLDYSNQIDRLNEERSDNGKTLPEINPETKLEIGTEVYVAFPTMWSITAQAQNPYPEGLYGVRSPYSKLPDVLDYRYFAYAEYKGKLYPVLKGIILKVASISTEEEIDSNANQDQVLDRVSLTNGAKHILEFSRSEDYGWGTKVEDLWTGTQNLLPESYEGERKSYINFYKEMPQAGFFHVPAGGSAWAQLFPVDKCEILNPKDNT